MKAFNLWSKISILIILMALVSCKKDAKENQLSFNLNNLKGYAIVFTTSSATPTTNIAVFGEDNEVTHASVGVLGTSTFNVNNDQLILNGINETFKVQNEKIVSFSDKIKTAELIKTPDQNQLTAKTFTGIYHDKNGNVLHPKFFYKFGANLNKVEVGYEVGTTIRTEDYTPFGNIAALIRQNSYIEFIVKMPDGSIVSNFRDGNSTSYGLFK
jgi:hypothetical protein